MFNKQGSEESLKQEKVRETSLDDPNLSLNTSSTKSTPQKRSPPSKPPRRKYSGQLTPQKTESIEKNMNSNINPTLSPKIINSTTNVEKINIIRPQNEDYHDSVGSEDIFSPDSNYFDGSSGEFSSLPKRTFSDQNLPWDKQCSNFEEAFLHNSLNSNNFETKLPCSTSLHSVFHPNSFISPYHNVFSPGSLYFTLPSYHSSSGVHSLPPFIQSSLPRETTFDQLNRKEEKFSSKDTFYDKLRKDEILNSVMTATNTLKPPCHRRHHSDPVLSFDNKVTKKSSIVRTASQRSHTFVGSSTNKPLKKLSFENLKNQQYFGGIKDPILLTAEVKALQNINEKLWQYLHSVQSQLDMLEKYRHVSKGDLTRPTQFSDLLAEVYYAQRERDQAMQARLRLVTQERDSAVNQLQQLLQYLGSGLKQEMDSSDEDDDMEENLQDTTDFLGVNKILKNLESTHSPIRLTHQKETLLANLYKARDHKKRRLSQELRVILAERDAAIEKARSLEEELMQWRHSNNIWQADTKQWETNLLDTLRQVISERDVSMAKVSELEEKLRLCYNLQSSLIGIGGNQQDVQEVQKLEVSESADESAHKAFSNSSNTFITSLLQPNVNNEEKLDIQSDVTSLSLQLEAEKRARELAEEKYRRLERLVNVLQKKVNGLNVGVSV